MRLSGPRPQRRAMRRCQASASACSSSCASVHSRRSDSSARPSTQAWVTARAAAGVDQRRMRVVNGREGDPAHVDGDHVGVLAGLEAADALASSPSASAPPSVAMRTAACAGSAVGSPLLPLASSAARRVSANRSSAVVAAAPSLPSATLMPGAAQRAHRAEAAGELQVRAAGSARTWTRLRASSSRSSGATWVTCTACRRGAQQTESARDAPAGGSRSARSAPRLPRPRSRAGASARRVEFLGEHGERARASASLGGIGRVGAEGEAEPRSSAVVVVQRPAPW